MDELIDDEKFFWQDFYKVEDKESVLNVNWNVYVTSQFVDER